MRRAPRCSTSASRAASASLSDYKERFGARPHDYPELRIERIPVTAVDRAARSVVKRAIGFREP